VAKITVLLADDNEAMIAELREELADKCKIVGVAENGEQALEMALRLEPDVLVLDIGMPVMTGLEITEQLREKLPGTRILFLTIHEEPEYVTAAFAAGASGYVTKRRVASDLSFAIREVHEGRRFLSPTLRRL
jgi:DNA-binding NarL/FixJ family response regulator